MRALTSSGAPAPGLGTRTAREERLRVGLDVPLPGALAVGKGTALFVCGTCFHTDARIHSLAFVVAGVEQPVVAHSMPRLDYFASLHPGLDPFASRSLRSDPASEDDPLMYSYRSGFWGIVRVGPRVAESCELRLRARLVGGGEATAPLARLRLAELPPPPTLAEPEPRAGPFVAICMASYEPPMDLFRRQLESIRSQTHRNWVCIISDDCSSPASFAAIQEEVADDPRFIVSRSPRRLGFYLNFERALSLSAHNADYIALADQDDRWYPEKLETLVQAIGSAQLVYSDARVIGHDDAVLSQTYWSKRHNNHSDILSVLVANSVTGAASLFRRELLDYVLPFPPSQFAHFHDHWIALTALAVGEIAFLDRPLYDYVQHDSAALGHAEANRMVGMRERLGSLKRDPRERARKWRLHYFVDVARLTECATILRMRAGEEMAAPKRRVLDRFVRTDRSVLALARLWARGARELIGTPETLGAEWMLAYAFTWRRLLAASTRDRPIKGLRLDAVPPPDLALAPGARTPVNVAARAIAEKVAPLTLRISDAAPVRVNLLIPTIDLAHFFGGYIGKFNLVRRLAERGLHVRIVTVDPVPPLPRRWQESIESYGGLEDVFERVEVAFGREQGVLEVSPADSFIATTWWTAHVADAAVRALQRERFLYLIQEYEPFTFPMGTYAALARESYDFPHHALFSSELLRDYFRRHRIGVYAEGIQAGDGRSASFQNAITRIPPPTLEELARRETRRLLFYARPEPHASRNMFELGLLALQEAAGRGAFREGWELHGIGTVEGNRTLGLGAGAKLELLARSDQDSYAKLLGEHDLGLALMYTPHPSLVPIEMASAGMLTVTNSFENKTPEAMSEISPNLLAAPPTLTGIAQALCDASERVGDFGLRVRGSHVAWSRDWNDSFSDSLLDHVMALLGA